jgi:hypothetical protein
MEVKMIHDQLINKLQSLSIPLLKEVDDFIEFLVIKNNDTQWQKWNDFLDSVEIIDSDFQTT